MVEQPGAEGGTPTDAAPALTAGERRGVALWTVVPVLLVAGALLALVAAGRLGVVDVVVGTVLYGGLLGLTAGVVAHERATAGHCPRCGTDGVRGATTCATCDYDLAHRPVHVCPEGHERRRSPGLCTCGRRLVERRPAPGVGRSVRRTLWAGAWLLVFLVGTGLLLRLT